MLGHTIQSDRKLKHTRTHTLHTDTDTDYTTLHYTHLMLVREVLDETIRMIV